MDVGLIGFPLLLLALILANLTLGLVLQHGILATRKLCYGVTEYVFILLHATVFHAVLQHRLALHD